MLRHFTLIVLIGFFAAPVIAENPVPERRQVVTKDVDFYGSDLQTLFDTTLKACENACLGNPNCTAFTYNSRSNSCFPKSDVSDKQPYEGAISAEIFPTSTAVLSKAPQLQVDLKFLDPADISNATALARDIGHRHPGGQWDTSFMLESAQDRIVAQDYLNAMRWTGAAVAETDTSVQWSEYARLSALIETNDSGQKRRYMDQSLNGSINAYLRAQDDPSRVNALMIMADAMQFLGRGRDMVPALRLAESIQPRDEVVEALEAAIAKYGFRIIEHRADNETSAPRICAEFSEPLIKVGRDYTPFVRVPDPGMVIEANENQICIDGVQHGARYKVTFRKGLPAASGETLIKDVDIAIYVQDRSPSVNFPGRAYVLPKTSDAALPIETVNLDEVELVLRRVSDRNLMRTIQTEYFGRPLSAYQIAEFSNEIAEEVWSGSGEVGNELNQTITTRLPLGDLLAGQEPGVYALSARIAGVPIYDDPGATQWFVLSDLGLTTFKGTDGLHVFVRNLGDAQVKPGVDLTLLSRSNRELGKITTDAQGYALFEPGLIRGTGASEPALVLVQADEDDMTFLSLTDPAFDLSDRGVEGRRAAPPVDVFLATDRGAYRAGEIIHATVLARDSLAQSITGLPLTAILTRPDGVEYSRNMSGNDRAGGSVFTLPIGETAPRGTWTLEIKADVDAPALASTQVLVEDFLPERIDFEMDLVGRTISPGETAFIGVSARYLFGAPGAGLQVSGFAKLRALRELDDYPGYQFGQYDAYLSSPTGYADGGVTNADGKIEMALDLPAVEQPDRPYEAQFTLSVQEGSGRPVERTVTEMLAPPGDMIGIKPAFVDVVPEGGDAAFQIIGINSSLDAQPMEIRWSINRIETRYQWYQQYGNWNWEPITTRKRVASGTAELIDDPLSISTPVEWGRYEIVVERIAGPYVATSHQFYAGWYAPADVSSTPDTLELSLDKPLYSTGETASLRIAPRFAGTALVSVMSNRLIEMKAIEVEIGETVIPLEVTEEWGAGAYVSAQVVRPMDVTAGQNPARSLGLAYATVDPGAKALNVSIDVPEIVRPRETLEAIVKVEGLARGQSGYVTLAAVDLGILNLTGFNSPDPTDHFFGQRQLGVEIRDLYGRLINGMNGALGQVRSGGDAGSSLTRQSPPPTEDLVAFFSGPIEVGADGTVQARFDLSDFNGTVRLMAVAWSDTSVGQADQDVIVRDPVVVTATLPRFLAPGDQSELMLEIVHAEGPAGRVGLDVTSQGVTLGGSVPSGFDLKQKEKQVLRLPIVANDVGDHQIRVALTTPDGLQLTKHLALGVRSNDPSVSQTRRFSLGVGDEFVLDDNVFAGFLEGTSTATVSAGPLSKLNVPGLLTALDRYPYGCTEQVTSRAMPLLYFSQVADSLGLGSADQIEARIDQAIAQVLTRQASSGGFGLWRARSGDFWLDAYVADFLSRARAEGHDVPMQAFGMAMDNLRNRVNYAPDFDTGGEDIAYALMVLAREGAARIGDLRYYADVKAEAFATPLAAAQLGAALASYGDQTRADRMFAQAMRLIAGQTDAEATLWRADYGTRVRDRAGVLALATQAGSSVVNTNSLATSLVSTGPHMSTQEQTWTILAAAALIEDPGASGLTLNGDEVAGPFVRRFRDQDLTDQRVRNEGTAPTDLTLTLNGVPAVPEPAGGYGYALTRAYYDMEGNLVELSNVPTGTRLVVVLSIESFEKGEARLIIDDPLPAGFEIDNPNLLRSGDVRSLDWLDSISAEHTEFRSDRFLAAVDWRSDRGFELAYIVRAVAPGIYHHPAATVEDMYRPQYRAWTDTSRMQVSR